jgi:hypothetical protein
MLLIKFKGCGTAAFIGLKSHLSVPEDNGYRNADGKHEAMCLS